MILKPPLFVKPIHGHPLGPAGGLVGLWLFNEGSGGQVFDSSGNNNHGTFVGDLSWSTGQLGPVTDGDGNGDYISVPDSPSLQITGEISIVASFCVRADTTYRNIVGKTDLDSDYGDYALRLSNSTLSLHVNQTVGTAAVTGTKTITTNRYYQAAGTYNSVTGDIRIYVDGVLDNSGTDVGTMQTSAENLILHGGYALTSCLNGWLEYVFLYNRALTASEIALLYKKPFCMFEREPIELWTAATIGGVPPVGNAGIMTPNTGFWGPTF